MVSVFCCLIKIHVKSYYVVWIIKTVITETIFYIKSKKVADCQYAYIIGSGSLDCKILESLALQNFIFIALKWNDGNENSV